MFRFIKIIFNALILVLALIGFNAIGGQKYVEMIKSNVISFVQKHAEENAKKIGNFSNLHEEFQIDNTVNILGYKAVIAEHKVSGQKMCIIDSGKNAILTKEDIKSADIDKKLKELSGKFKYQAITFQEIKTVSKGEIKAYGQEVPYVKFEAKSNKLPFTDIAGIIISIKTSDNSNKLALSVNEKKKYSQLITEEFFKNVTEN